MGRRRTVGQRGHNRTPDWVTGCCCSLTSGVLPIYSGWLGAGGGLLAPLLSLGLDRGVQVSLLSAESLTEGWLVSGPTCPWCGRLFALPGLRWQGGSRFGHRCWLSLRADAWLSLGPAVLGSSVARGATGTMHRWVPACLPLSSRLNSIYQIHPVSSFSFTRTHMHTDTNAATHNNNKCIWHFHTHTNTHIYI